jgi:hypothetical protein
MPPCANDGCHQPRVPKSLGFGPVHWRLLTTTNCAERQSHGSSPATSRSPKLFSLWKSPCQQGDRCTYGSAPVRGNVEPRPAANAQSMEGHTWLFTAGQHSALV